ncbi:MAG: MDR family MFS transporter [Actinomycetes bacterium]
MVGWLRRLLAPTVSGLPTTFWWLWSGTLVNRAGAFVLPFLAFYLTDELALTPAFVGLVLGSFGLGSVVASLLGGVLADRLGRRPVLLASQVSTAGTLVALGLTTTPAAVLLLCTVLGLTSNISRPAYAAMMTDIVEPADRVRAFSLNYWAINLGFAIAPVLGGMLARSGYVTLFLVDAATTLVFAVLVYLRVPESHPGLSTPRSTAGGDGARAVTSGSMRDVLRDRVFLSFVLLTFGFAVVFMQHLSSLPVQMDDDGLSPAQYGTVLALNGALIVLVTVPATRWLQRFPRSRVMATSGVFVGVGFGATAWASTPAQYAVTVAIWTVGEVIGAAVGPAIVADLSPAAMRGRYQGLFSFSFALAALVAPLAGGAVYDVFGGPVLWAGCAALSLVTAAGHLVIGPARARRLEELRAAETAVPHEPTDAVPVPVAHTLEEADGAVR